MASSRLKYAVKRKSERKPQIDFRPPVIYFFLSSVFAFGETLLFVGKVERISVLRFPLRRGKFVFRKLLFRSFVFVARQIYVRRINLESTFITLFVDETDLADRYAARKGKTNVNARTRTRIIPIVNDFVPTCLRGFATALLVFKFVFDFIIRVRGIQIGRRSVSVDSKIYRIYAFIETVYANPYLFYLLIGLFGNLKTDALRLNFSAGFIGDDAPTMRIVRFIFFAAG